MHSSTNHSTTQHTNARTSSAEAAIIRRIRALLLKAESTPYPEEAEALMAKAHELRQSYLIDELIAGGEDTTDAAGCAVERQFFLQAPWVRYQFSLLGSVARANYCRVVLATGSGLVSGFGREDDLRHTATLFETLNRHRDRWMRHGPGAFEAVRAGRTSAYRRSFQYSFALRIGDRLEEIGEQARAAATAATGPAERDRALALINERDAAAEALAHAVFPHTSTLRISATDAAGYRAGLDAAEAAPLSPEPDLPGSSASVLAGPGGPDGKPAVA